MKQELNLFIDEISLRKGEDVCLVDTEGHMHPYADYILIVSALNQIHLKSLAASVVKYYKKNKDKALSELDYFGTCGKPESNWVILDFNNLLVHIMTKDLRLEYKFDDLFEKYECYRYH